MAVSEFVHRRRVQFRDTDASGIVHFSMYFCFAEEAEHGLWRAAGLRIEDPHSEFAWPRVGASFEYLTPLRFEDEFEVHLRVVAKSAKTFQYQAVLLKDGDVLAVGRTTTICVRKMPDGRLRAVNMPEDVASRFAVTPALEVPRRRAATP